MVKNADVVIIGAGIVGLAIARELARQDPSLSIIILEKESHLGQHASGRNSGILHSGIYYSTNSLKAQFCTTGAKELLEYCQLFNLPYEQTGKILLPVRDSDNESLQILYERAKANGANIFLVDKQQLKELEPHIKPCESALYTPDTAVVDPHTILKQIRSELNSNNIQVLTDHEVIDINSEKRFLKTKQTRFNYHYLFNCAGVSADRLSKKAGLGFEYVILPFKGRYYKLVADFKIKHQIYPVPDLQMPFLGIHITKNIHQELFLGPTASPVLGRYHYENIKGLDLRETPLIVGRLLKLYWKNKQNFRQLVHQQTFNNVRKQFLQAARQLLPSISDNHLQACNKVGIRPQLINRNSNDLVHDFITLNTDHSTHVLNAISPAFTSAFPFARFLVARMMHQVIDNG